MRISRSLIVPYPARAMFALVDDIESYPRFLPWCAAAQVARRGESVAAALEINFRGLKSRFATDNRHRRDRLIEMRLADGPLSDLRGFWKFCDLGDGRSRVDFFLEYGFANRALEKISGGVFRYIFAHFVDAFVTRAREIYGGASK
jgi:ribosome-associated toxin RatA of RatAB toxin-antitoxin module